MASWSILHTESRGVIGPVCPDFDARHAKHHATSVRLWGIFEAEVAIFLIALQSKIVGGKRGDGVALLGNNGKM
jgi:hypothetical protein